MKDEQKPTEIRDQIAATISDPNLSDSLIRDYEAIVKIAVDTAVQKMIDGLSVDLSVDYRGIDVSILMDGKEISRSWAEMSNIKYSMVF